MSTPASRPRIHTLVIVATPRSDAERLRGNGHGADRIRLCSTRCAWFARSNGHTGNPLKSGNRFRSAKGQVVGGRANAGGNHGKTRSGTGYVARALASGLLRQSRVGAAMPSVCRDRISAIAPHQPSPAALVLAIEATRESAICLLTDFKILGTEIALAENRALVCVPRQCQATPPGASLNGLSVG